MRINRQVNFGCTILADLKACDRCGSIDLVETTPNVYGVYDGRILGWVMIPTDAERTFRCLMCGLSGDRKLVVKNG